MIQKDHQVGSGHQPIDFDLKSIPDSRACTQSHSNATQLTERWSPPVEQPQRKPCDEQPQAARLRTIDSAARVVSGVQLLEPLARHVGVDLRGRDVGVAEQQLHGAQVGAVVEQVGGEGVAQRVR